MKFLRYAPALAVLAGLTPCLAAAAPEAPAPAAAGNATPVSFPTNPAPLTPLGPDPAVVSSNLEWSAAAGRDYLNSGLPDLAVSLLREALNQPGLDAAARDALNLDLASAYLALGKSTEAAAALTAVTTKTTASYQLRSALLAARMGEWGAAASRQALIMQDSLTPAERPWYYVITALLAEQRQDAEAAHTAWEKARDLATTPLQGYQFSAALWLSRLLFSPGRVVTAAQAQTLQQQADSLPNRSVGGLLATEQAVILYQLNQREEAVAVVNKWLQAVPDSDHQNKNSLRLLAAFLAGGSANAADATRAQTMLRQVLQDRLEPGAPGTDSLRQAQVIALATLQNNLRDARDRTALKDFLDSLIRQDHLLLKEMLLLQSKLAGDLGFPDDAEKYASLLLEKFPMVEGRRDPEREDARWKLADIAAHRQPPQNREAANALMELRNELPPGPERTKLLKPLADLFFLDKDYRRAAEAYATLLAEPTPQTPRGLLLRRAVDSELSDGQLPAAIARLDAYGALPDVDVLDRWHAEWNVLMALRRRGDDAAAFARLNTLLTPANGKTAPPLALRLRLLWLAARLAVDVRDPSAVERAQTLRQEVDAVPKEGAGEIKRELRDQLAAEALLLSYLAAHDAKKTDEENKFFTQLQDNYPGSDAGLYAMFFRAEALAAEDKSAEAQSLIRKLADQYPAHEYAPLARFQEALYAIPRGAANNYEEPIALLEKFASTYPNHRLAYRARLELARLNRLVFKFNDALPLYKNLLDTYPDHPLRPEAEMGWAESLQGLAALSGDPRQRAEAIAALERLVDLPIMPADKSVEAGVKWGSLLANGDKSGNNIDLDAAVVAFTKVKFLYLKKDTVAKLEQTPAGASWMSQCLFSLAQVLEKQNKMEEAQGIYEQWIAYNLPSADIAQKHLLKPPTGPVTAPPPASAPSATPPAAPVPTRGGATVGG